MKNSSGTTTRYVIIRDDDTNALTPPACLERLYRPFLDRGLPVNLATIPNVRTDARTPDGNEEGFLFHRPNGHSLPAALPIGTNRELVSYLRANPEFHITQHGYQHDYFEFDRHDTTEIARRLDNGRQLLYEAGLKVSRCFVAPHDKLSRTALREVAKRFDVLSTGWFELRRLPVSWWPAYVLKRARRRTHWRIGGKVLLTHPGCLLSCHRRYGDILAQIQEVVENQQLTILVTHWWEYFRNGIADEEFISVLHATADYLGSRRDIQVVTFDDVPSMREALN